LKILHVSKRYHPFRGGVERYVRDLANMQATLGHEVTVLTIDRDVLNVLPDHLPHVDADGQVRIARVAAIGGQRKQFLAEIPGRALRILAHADVVHHHDPRFLFEAAIATRGLTGRPLIAHTHGLILHTQNLLRLKAVLLRYYYGPIYRHLTTTVIADSESDRDILRDACHVPDERIELLLNGIDIRRFLSLSPEPISDRILVFGRIDQHKGHADLLRSLASVDVPWQLDVVGSGPESLLASLRQMTVELGLADRVRWRGTVDDGTLDQMMSSAALVCFPSRFEGFGLALVEALAVGCQVLASDLPTHREILGSQLQRAVVDFRDASASAAITESLARGTEVSEADIAERRARAALFSVDRVAAEIEALYQRLNH
jgi:alpha-1,3-mannosyltransferase